MWQYCVYLLTSKLLHFTSEHFILGYSLRLEFVNSCLISTRLPYVHSGFVVSTSESVGLARTSQDIQLSHFISLDFEDQRIWTSRPQIRHNVRVGERTVLKYVSHLAPATNSTQVRVTPRPGHEQYSSTCHISPRPWRCVIVFSRVCFCLFAKLLEYIVMKLSK